MYFLLKDGDFPLSYLYHDSFFRGVVVILKEGRLECCVVGVLFFRKHIDCFCYWQVYQGVSHVKFKECTPMRFNVESEKIGPFAKKHTINDCGQPYPPNGCPPFSNKGFIAGLG